VFETYFVKYICKRKQKKLFGMIYIKVWIVIFLSGGIMSMWNTLSPFGLFLYTIFSNKEMWYFCKKLAVKIAHPSFRLCLGLKHTGIMTWKCKDKMKTQMPLNTMNTLVDHCYHFNVSRAPQRFVYNGLFPRVAVLEAAVDLEEVGLSGSLVACPWKVLCDLTFSPLLLPGSWCKQFAPLQPS
jgi:hypothetical protein